MVASVASVSASVSAPLPPLSDRIIAAVRERFRLWGHEPSPAHWIGLEAIAQEIEDQALGKAQASFAVSALPTGMGKTTVLIEAIRILTSDPAFADVGIAVFTQRLDMIDRMLDELRADGDPLGLDGAASQRRLAVVTGKKNVALNSKGRGRFNGKGEWVSDHASAQVMLATQEKLLTIVAKGQWHRDYETFWRFEGRPRMVRVWDESIMPAKPLTTTPARMRAYAAEVDAAEYEAPEEQKAMRAFAEEVRALSASIVEAAKQGAAIYYMPPLEDWLAELPHDLDETDTVGNILWRMAGKPVRLWKDPTRNAGDGTIITYRELLPQNLAPMLILDASAHLRQTYQIWNEGRGGVRMLPAEPKTYRGLTIHHWNHAAGKAVYRNTMERAELAEGCARAFLGLPPGERALLVYRKPGEHERHRHDLLRETKGHVHATGGNPDLLEGVTWGRHTASNEWKDVRHVIVAGLLQYSDEDNEAFYRAAAGMDATKEVDAEKIDALRRGEIQHHLLQAVGRGAVRRAEPGRDVPEGCTVHAVFTSSGGSQSIPASVLRDTFRDADVVAWEPFGPAVPRIDTKRGNRDRLIEAIEARLGEGTEATFELRDLIPAGMTEKDAKALFVSYHKHLGGTSAQGQTTLRLLAERGLIVTKTKANRPQGKGTRRTTPAVVFTVRRAGRFL